ncbi:MAG: 50S ribosome-binding GTPase, partial [Oceanibaculum nanhaiense]|nr:50S ribosome-binding GTPase [Oceanibaculum nanhaiense]
YPFTTLWPQLGVVERDGEAFVVADIPGLIEGAHEGAGLGTRFLGHVERTGVLLHLIDGTQEDPVKAYRTIRKELKLYAQELAEKREIVALNKIDAIPADELKEKLKKLKRAAKADVMAISAVTGEGVTEVLRALRGIVKDYRAAEKRAEAVESGIAVEAEDWRP